MTSLNTSLQESHHQSCQSVPILHSIIPGTSRNTILHEVIGTDNTRELLYPAAEHQLCGRCKQLFPRFEIGQHIFFCGAEQERDPFRRDNRNEKLFDLLPPRSIHSLLKTYHLYAQFDPSVISSISSLIIHLVSPLHISWPQNPSILLHLIQQVHITESSVFSRGITLTSHNLSLQLMMLFFLFLLSSTLPIQTCSSMFET